VKANAARTREGAPFGEPQPSGQALIVARLDNDPVTGIPGTFDPKDPTHAPFWALAPAEMAWESAPGVAFTGPELCAQLKDPNRNGHRELSDILEHLKHEPLVNWAFNPGTRPNGEARTTPPISHDGLIQAFQQWIAEGAPCPNS